MLKRRKFNQHLLSGLVGTGFLSAFYAWQLEPFWLEFAERPMPIKHLPKELAGKTLMQISDIHIGNRFDYNYIIDAFKQAQSYQADFVVYTGDYVSYESKEQFEQLEQVLQQAVHGKLGTIGILGNHDYGKNWADTEVANTIVNLLENAKIKVLRNQQQHISGINFIGLDDYWGTNFNPKAVLHQHQQEKANIVLCHNPDVCDLGIWNGYEGWILSGHTHGGQCKPPFLPPPMLPVKNKKYVAGEVDLKDGRRLYINRAAGHLWQLRFNVRPEITVFTLEVA